MSEAELIELAFNAVESALAGIALYLTLVSGYLIVAYVAGKDLKKSQLILINILFIFFTAFFVISIYGAFGVSYALQLEFAELRGVGRDFADGIWRMNQGLCIALILGIMGCLHFMHQIRRTEDDNSA